VAAQLAEATAERVRLTRATAALTEEIASDQKSLAANEQKVAKLLQERAAMVAAHSGMREAFFCRGLSMSHLYFAVQDVENERNQLMAWLQKLRDLVAPLAALTPAYEESVEHSRAKQVALEKQLETVQKSLAEREQNVARWRTLRAHKEPTMQGVRDNVRYRRALEEVDMTAQASSSDTFTGEEE
jgi:chromosome segregation ATPase